jgi:uncharacterized protein (UPF0332 family)
MTLSIEKRNAVVRHRLQKAKETLREAVDIANIKCRYAAANRLYYACYYAVTALLIQNGFSAGAHKGVIALLGLHFVSRGIISKEQNKFYQQLFFNREKGDYDDWFEIEEHDILPLLAPARQFIGTIEQLVNEPAGENHI